MGMSFMIEPEQRTEAFGIRKVIIAANRKADH